MKKFLTAMCLALLLLCGAVGVGFGFGGATTAQAASYSSPKYKTNGSYSTGGAETVGCPSNFGIYMHAASQNSNSGTISNDKVLNWTYVYIKIEVSAITNHVSFKLTRNGYTHTSKSLSGNANQTLFSSSLSDGEYELTYVGNYKKNWMSGTTTFTYKYRFVIDKTGPAYTLNAGGSTISSGSYTNKQVVYSVSDYKPYCIYYRRPGNSTYNISFSESYTIPATDANNGWWYLYAEDWYYNLNSTVSVYMDTVKPVGTVKSGGYTVSNGGYTNKAVSYTATDAGGVSYYQYKTPSSGSWLSYTGGTSVSGSYGWYTFRAVDRAGNVSDEYKVYYDAVQPTGTLYGGTVGKTSGSYTNAEYVKYVASSPYSGIANCYVKMPNTGYYTSYTSGSQLTAEGTYSFYCVSKTGTTSATVSITLDKSKPVGTLYGGLGIVANNGYTNAAYVKFLASDRTAMTAYVKRPGSSAYASYTLGTQFTAEGTYSFYVIDAASNRSDTYTVTLSRQIPQAQLYVDGEPLNNNSYTSGGHISFECEESCFVMLPGTDAYVPYLSGAEYYKPGKYVFYGIDAAKNHSGYYSVVIDRTAKPLTLHNVSDGLTDGDVVIDWTDGDLDTYAPVKSVTVNGKPYEKGETIYTIDSGVYRVGCEDASGNVWETEFRSTKQNVLTKTLQKKYYEAFDGNGKYNAFSSYDSAFAFAAEREKCYIRTAEWNNATWDTGIAMDLKDSANADSGTYYIYKKSGSPAENVAYFTETRLNEVIAEYAAEGIESYYYWQKEPAEIWKGENLFGYSDEKTVLAHSVSLGENTGYLIDGELFTGSVYNGEGIHILTAFDEWGNTCDYELTVVRRAPDILYALGAGEKNVVTFDRNYYLKDSVTVSIRDEYDEFAMFDVYAEDGILLARLSLEESWILDSSGKYTVQAVNHFGVSEIFTIIISLDAPKAVLTENTDDKRLAIEIVESADKHSHLQTLEIYKSVDGGESWTLLIKDDYGKAVSLDSLSYAFRTSGLYRVVLTDEFRTGIDAVTAQFDYTQRAPEGILIGVENGGYTNGTVAFEWTDEAIVTLDRDSEEVEYISGQRLTENGSYTLTFENYDGYKKVHTFVIDTLAPEVGVVGVENGESVNADVSVSFAEENLTAELYINGEFIRAYASETVLTEDGDYRIIVTDLAENSTVVTFTIDKIADFEINVNDKGLANSVTVTANEQLQVTLTKDGETVALTFGEAITVPGEYALKLTDALGNCKEISFTVVKPLVKSFEHNFDDMPGFEKVTVNGEDKRLNYGTLELTADGTYEVGVVADGVTYSFTVTVDCTAPTLTLSGVGNGGTTKDGVILSELSENAELKVYLNDTQISYTLGDELYALGNYRVVLTDECGNRTEYTFEIVYSMNGGAIALIVIAIVVIMGGTVTVILMRKKGKFGKGVKKKEKAE